MVGEEVDDVRVAGHYCGVLTTLRDAILGLTALYELRLLGADI